MHTQKILERQELAHAVRSLQAAGKKVVFTNGCFDILHVGHVRYLAEAKSLGDILVVGLNSDASVGRLKPGRPVTTEKDRAEVLAALAAVDYVTIFSEDSPYELIFLLRPDLLVKGGDWRPEDIVGSDLVSEVKSLHFIGGASTTGIIERILSSGCHDATMKKSDTGGTL
ncbi:MAG TPA: D-glycero-beta-D-manno-heptose 1-phosphate adenylyltransferase [Dissulfurispiraceae bacterium]|nr:D-glycero-beta-D-manno-heptose 1-phosphate adenylyltransferase [Dissulfurispiraceae bacterium]